MEVEAKCRLLSPASTALLLPLTDTFTLNSPEHGSGKKRSHPAYLWAGRRYPAKPWGIPLERFPPSLPGNRCGGLKDQGET